MYAESHVQKKYNLEISRQVSFPSSGPLMSSISTDFSFEASVVLKSVVDSMFL